MAPEILPVLDSTNATRNLAVETVAGKDWAYGLAAFGADTPTPVTAADPLPVSASSLPLPSGAATAANLGTGPTTLLKAEDAVHATGDTGVMALAVRKDVAAASAGTDGDYQSLISDAFGRQHVRPTLHDPSQQVSRALNATTAQTGAALWAPASGKKIALQSLFISTYGAVAGKITIWFGAVAGPDITYTAGTDQPVWIGDMAPSAGGTPGAIIALAHPIYCNNADYALRVTTSAAVSINITAHGFEL